MNNENAKLLNEAIPHLKIRNIYLFESSFRRPTPQPDEPEVPALIMLKRGVKLADGEISADDGSKRSLQVIVDLGMRVAAADGEDSKEAAVYLEIEAAFLAEYEIVGEVSAEAIQAFANHNSVHNVWPFWRQHVFDVVQRGDLPHLDVPLFSVNPPDSAEDSSK